MRREAVELISVGNELLIGKVVNTNAAWLAARISALGGEVSRCTIVRDDISDLSAAITESLEREAEWIIITGGLGPTFDDLTLEGVAKATNRPLKLNTQALTELKKRYEKLQSEREGHIELNAARLKMVNLPEGSEPLHNPIGSAPGVFLSLGEQKLFSLPGVPAEMESIFETSIAPKMKSVFGVKARFEATLQVRGVGEGTLAPSLAELKRKNPDVYIKSHPKGHINGRLSIEMHIAASGREAQLVKSSVDSVAKALEDIVTSHGGEVARIE